MLTVADWYLGLDENLVVTSPYGPRGSGFHYGTDISRVGGVPPDYPTPLPSRSLIHVANWHEGGYGWYVRFQQVGANYHILIGHLAYLITLQGNEYEAGYNVGAMGSTGNSTGNHWHIEVWHEGDSQQRVNPATYPIYLPDQPGPGGPLTPFQLMMGRRILPRRRS